ncbi:hypothetical protein COL9_14170 [Helicobacter pylori]
MNLANNSILAIALIFSMRFDAILKKSLDILACQWLKKVVMNGFCARLRAITHLMKD